MTERIILADREIQDIMIRATDGYLDVCVEIGHSYFELTHDSIRRIPDCPQNMTSVIPDEINGLSVARIKTNGESLFIVFSGGYGLSYGFGIEDVDGAKEVIEFFVNSEGANRLAQLIGESDVRDVEFSYNFPTQ